MAEIHPVGSLAYCTAHHLSPDCVGWVMVSGTRPDGDRFVRKLNDREAQNFWVSVRYLKADHGSSF